MSYTTIYKITANGDVESVGEARNSNAFAMVIWSILSKKYGFPEFPDLRVGYAQLWALFGTDKISKRDDIVQGLTFDRIWVQKRGLPKVIQALTSFWDTDVGIPRPTETIPAIAELLKKVDSDPTVRGACFQVTSITDDFWSYTADDGETRIDYNFDRDKGKNLCLSGEPEELFELLKTDPEAPLVL